MQYKPSFIVQGDINYCFHCLLAIANNNPPLSTYYSDQITWYASHNLHKKSISGTGFA
jgi:hypothetical protein